MYVDNWNPNTYLWILQEVDVPYIPEEWNNLLTSYGKDKSKITGTTIIGRYLSKMKFKQLKGYRWKDTKRYMNNWETNYSDWFVKDNNKWGWKDEFLTNEVKQDILDDKWLMYKSRLTDKPIYDSNDNKIKKNNNKKENKNNMNDFGFGKVFGKMFSPVAPGYAKMGVNGEVAIRVGNTYKTYNFNTGKLVDCDNFAFDMDGMFWVVPTFKVECGDIIMVNGKPRYVIEVKEKTIKTFSYENSTIDEIVPEYHVFMGKTYCYGKIFSPFMNMDKSDNMMSNMMQMAMMSQMFNGNSSNNNGFMGMNPMMMMFMMNNKGGNMFEDMFAGAFNFGEDESKIADKEDK